MFIAWLMFLALVASLALPVIGIVAGISHIKRTRLEASGRGRSSDAAILDSLERLHIRLDALSERLVSVEENVRVTRRDPPVGLEAGGEGDDAV